VNNINTRKMTDTLGSYPSFYDYVLKIKRKDSTIYGKVKNDNRYIAFLRV
jgi:hypothetical protein